jgi:hypothetical protein
MSFFNVYYITLCRLHEKKSILNEVKIWEMCYLGMVTLVVAHYIANLPISHKSKNIPQEIVCIHNKQIGTTLNVKVGHVILRSREVLSSRV